MTQTKAQANRANAFQTQKAFTQETEARRSELDADAEEGDAERARLETVY